MPPGNNGTFGYSAFDLANRLLREENEPTRPSDFGPYRFLGNEPIGRGSLGDVWLAEEPGADRLVAVKFLVRASQQNLAANEIRNQGKLEHTYIARLYNYGVLEDETPWIAMEYVEGQPLNEHCHTRGYTIEQRLRLFHAVAEAVQHAHTEKVDHGDLKPSNILVRNDGTPKLLDFGLARSLQQSEEQLRQQLSVLGFTPAYAAPEQFRGESAGFRSDVYSLGVVLYELLAGALPFDASERTYTEIESLKTTGQKPEPPSLVAGRKLKGGRGGGLSRTQWLDLDAICLRAMESDVSKRYSSVETLIQDLDRYLRCEPIAARQPHSWTYVWGRFIKRHRDAVAAATLMAVLITGGVTLYTVQLSKARNGALAEAARTEKVKQFFLDAFDHAAEDALPAEKSRIVNLFLDRGAKDARLLEDPVMRADIYQGFGTMYGKWGVLDRAERLMREALAIDNTHLSRDHPQTVKTKLALGSLLEDRGFYDEAITTGDEVLQVSSARSEYRSGLNLLADAHFHLGHLAIADSFYEKALRVDRQLYGRSHPEIADDLMNFGNFQFARGNYSQAETRFREALAMNESWFGKDSPQAADSASYVAAALYFQGSYETEELQLLRHALAVLEKVHGDMDIRVAFTVAQMGAVAIELKNLGEAEADFKRAAEIYRAVRGDDHQSVAIELANLASVYLARKEYIRAEQAFRDVIRRFEKTVPEDNYNIGIARIKLGHCLLAQGRYRDSEPELLKGYDILVKQAGSSAWWVKTARKDLTEVYDALRQPEKAAKFRSALVAESATLAHLR